MNLRQKSIIQFSKTNSYNIDIPLVPEENWCLVKLDPVDYINRFFRKEFLSLGNVNNDNTYLRDITIWSICSLKGIYISNNSYNIDNLPKEISAVRVNEELKLGFIEIPEGNVIICTNDEEDKEVVKDSPRKKFNKKPFLENFDESLNEIEKKSKELFNENLKRSGESLLKTQMRKLEKELDNIENDKPLIPKSHYDLKEVNSEILKKNVI